MEGLWLKPGFWELDGPPRFKPRLLHLLALQFEQVNLSVPQFLRWQNGVREPTSKGYKRSSQDTQNMCSVFINYYHFQESFLVVDLWDWQSWVLYTDVPSAQAQLSYPNESDRHHLASCHNLRHDDVSPGFEQNTMPSMLQGKLAGWLVSTWWPKGDGFPNPLLFLDLSPDPHGRLRIRSFPRHL